MSPAELRAEAYRQESEAAKANRGKVYIYSATGAPFVHDGRPESNLHGALHAREASEAEIQALCVIPEFAGNLARIRSAA